MASEFVNAYLKKREEEKKANPSSSVSDRSQFAQEYLSKRYEGDVSGMAQRADANDIYYDFATGKSYSASQRAAARAKEASYIKPRRLQSALDAAQSMQKEADRYSNILMREPESGVLMPDYDAIVAANNSQNSLSLAARSRALAQKALADYEKQYRTQLDSYGPYIDGSGKDVAGQYNARKKAVDDANQAYEDAFADYQKKQQAADYARRQDDKRKALQNEWAQYKQIQADKSKAETDAAEAWKSYYSMLPRAEDFASNQQNPYGRTSYEDRLDKVTSNRYSEEEQIRDLVMTDEELAIMTYLRNTQGEDAAQRYYNSLGLSERLKKHYENAFYEFGDENPVGASVVSAWHNLANEVYAPIGIAKEKLSGQEIDPDADYFKYGKLRDAARAGVMHDMGPTGQFVYQTLMSAVADSGVNGLIGAATGGSSWVGAGLTGLSGFTDMTRQIKERNGSDTQALVLGTIEGIAEVVTEKMGFDRMADMLTNKVALRAALQKTLSSSMSEFGEESITTVINQAADLIYGIVSGEETEFTKLIDHYRKESGSDGEAFWRTLLDMGGDTLMDGLGGALGGLVNSGLAISINKGASAIDNVATKVENKIAEWKSNRETKNAGHTYQTAQETAQAQQNAQVTDNQPISGNRAETAQKAETMARIERLAQETADAEMGEQTARQEMRQTEQQRVRQTPRQAAQTTDNASAESVHNAAAVYGRDAASFESHYEGGALQNYRRAFDAVYQAGKVNLSLEQVNQAGGEIVSGLSEQAKAEIWQAGRNAAVSVVVPGVSKQYVGKMNHNQRAQIRILDAIGKKYGIQIDVVNSLDYGRTAGNAALVGRNHIVVASDAMNSAYVQAGVHELVHNLRRESSAYYDAFSSVVLDTLKKDGNFDMQAAVAERIRQYAEQGQQLSEEDALEEIVAEAAPAALTNREAMRAFVKENRSLAEKVRDFFVRFADELRQIAAKYGAGNSRAEVDAMLRADAKDLVNIAEVLDMALSAAQDAQESAQVGVSETESTMSDTQLADGGIEVSGNDIAYPADADTLYSLRTLSKSDYVKERDKAAKQLSARLGISIEQANKYIDDISGVAAMIAADQSRLDFEAEPAFSALKKNSEYKWTVDFSTLCKKRLLYTGTFDAIQEQMADAILTEEDYIKLRDMMAQKGYEVACAFCYVESRRKNNGEIIDKFLDVYKKAQRDGTKMELGASNRRRAFATEAGFTPTIADFNTTNGILNIMHNHKGVYDAYMYFMNARGTSKPKLIETRTEYNSEILSLFRNKNAVNAMIKRGGLRLQSFSDFEVVNMLDMMQVVYDMSRVGLTSQAYTKVPAFARVFGQTGIKINESLVVKGLDANGQLIFDDVEGMPHEEAFRIREMYPENVGTILVGKDDATIRAAMADPRIDFIIPYHRSGWSETNMQALGIKGYTDYTKSQNEISQIGEKIKNFYPSEYWDFSKSGDENAQIYLEKCAESRRIPKFPQFAGESGYWKTLIDFKMYDNNGNGAPQRPVTPDVNLTEARRVLDEYKGGHRTLPVAQDVVKEFIEWYRNNRTGNEAASSEVRELSDAGTKFSLRKKDPPEKTLTAYKVFVAFENKPGQLFPPKVANPNGESTPVGVWLDADEGETAKDKNGNELVNTLGRKQVKAGGKGTQGGSGVLAYRPGWHLGELPMANQFLRVNPETGVKDLFPANFIWAECEIAADRNYQEEAMSYGYTKNGKFQHSLAGLPKLPTDGYYMYRTNPDPTTLPWYITGAMKVTKILSDAETDQILRDHGIEPMKRQGGPIDLEKFGFKAGEVGENGTKFSLKDSEAFKKWFGDSKVVDKNGDPLVVYHATDSEFNVFDRSKLGDFTSGNTDWQPAVRSAQIGFWFSDHDLAATVFTDPDKTKAVYLSIQKPYRTKLDSLWNALEHTRPETYVKRLQERGYDGLRVQDSEFGGVSYVAFEPTQIKSATNNSGAFDPANPDIRFSLKSPVEETKDLIAVHNLSEENLQKLLKLGGLPAPSIAIARAEFGYSAYGPISLVFDKNSIDPEANDKNRVYGADAWTPVVPSDEEYETPEDLVRAMYATQAERGEDRYLLDPETLQALAAPEYKSIDDIKEDSGRLGYVNPYEHGYEVQNLNRQLNDVINRLVDDYDFAESDAEASIRRAATLEHNIDTVIDSFASEEDGYHIDEEMAQEIIDLYEAAAALPTEFFEAKPQRAVRFDEVKAAIIPESTSESLKNELKERVGQVIEYEDGDEQARLEALNSLEEVKFSLKDTSEVDEQAKALLDGVDVELNADVVKAYARSALRAADKDAAKINQQVRQATGKILKDTASKYDRKTLESNMRAIVEAYARDGGEGVSQAAAEMAKAIIEKNTHLDTTLRDQYSALRRDLRENGVSLTETQKAEAASIYGSYNEFRRALMGTVKLTDKSMTLEARWDELSTMYPEIFRADTVEGDQINALMAFKQMMQPVYTNDFGMDMDTAAVDLGLRIQGDALSIAGAKEASKQLYGSAQKIENRVKKAYDAELKVQKKAKVAQFQAIAERLAEAKKLGDTQGYDSAMADYRKLVRKETGVKMPGGESMSPSAKMRFSQLAEDMQAARETNDTEAYQEAYKAYKELLKKERIQSTVVVPAVQEALNLARARFKANQEAKEGTVKKQKATQRVIKQAKALVDMLGNKKKGVRVPRMMQDNLLTLLEGLDINGRGAANKGEVTKQAAAMREQLTALRQTYQAIWDDQAKGEAPEVLDGLMMVINEEQRAQLDDALSILEQGGRFTLRSMTTEQLKALGDALMTVKQTISTIGVLWRKGRYQNVAELADASIQEMGKRPDARLNAVAGLNAGRDFLALDMLEPVSYGERLGQAGSEIIQGLYEGEREKFGRLREAQTATAAMMKDADVTSYDIGRWRSHVNTVRMGGHDVKLTDTQAMDIYLTAMRPQGKQHILGNGIRLKTSKQTGAQVFTVRITEADIAKVSDLLSDQQKRMAHKLQEYLAGDVAKWGNDVTQQLYLYDYFTEKSYWPLTSDPNVLKSKEPTTDFRLDALTNPGFLKPLKAGANNAVIIMDAFDVFNRHVAEMASYSGLAMPMIDAVNYLNYQQHDDDGLTTGSIKESMERLFGTGGQKYMTRLLQDLNHARHGDDLLALSKLGALYKKAAVTGKIRVVLQQPTAIARAAQEISPVYLAQGLKLGNKADIAEMEQHSALAWWKNNGSGMDIGVGRSADQVLWGDTSKAQTAMDKIETSGGLIDANRADAVTWAAMWRAVKRETQRIHPELQVGSEAYFRTVAERFDSIMDRTQVVDSVMHRSQIMRSQNGMVKELTAFKAEPIKSYNMLARAAMELGRNPKSRAAQAAVTRSALVFAANAALTALAEALFDVFKHRDDDDRLMEYLLDAKKGFLKEYTDEFLGSWLDNMNVIDLIPFATQAKDVLLNNDAPEMMSFEGLVSLRKAALTFKDHFVGENKQKTTTYGAIAPVLKAASQITGLPIAGIMANTEMLAKIADPQWLNYKAVSGKFADNYEALYAAILEGNKRAITRIRGRLAADTQGKSAKSPAQIDQGVANVLAEKDERIAQAYQLRKEGKSTQLVALKKQIMADGFTDAMVSAAINRYESQAKVQEKTTQEKDMDAQLTAKLFNYENLYAAMRTGSIEDVGIIVEYLQANSSAKDPAAAIRSQVSGEFKQEYLDAVMNGGGAESLKQKLLSLGLTEDDLNGWVKDARYAELKESMGEGDIADAKQTARELIDSGADVSNVVRSLNSKYRPLYIELINSGRTAEAEKLQKDLESLGLIKQKTGQNYYRKDYMDKWVTDYNNKNK